MRNVVSTYDQMAFKAPRAVSSFIKLVKDMRALYAGVELPLKTAQTSVLDERLYSNQVQLNVAK